MDALQNGVFVSITIKARRGPEETRGRTSTTRCYGGRHSKVTTRPIFASHLLNEACFEFLLSPPYLDWKIGDNVRFKFRGYFVT